MEARQLRFKLTFQARPIQSGDDFGTHEGDFEEMFTEFAAIKPKLGGEDVLAARLRGRNLVNITVRYSSDTAEVTTDWRAVDARNGKLYNLRSIIDPDGRRRWLEMLAEEGVLT